MNYVLAPLAGFTDAPFRRLCRENGADLAYTEMVSAAALAHDNSPTRHLMETMEGEGPVVCQLFGAAESDLAAAVRLVMRESPTRFVALDLNAGCPMTKVTKCGAGARLVEDPAKIARLLKAMKDFTDLPVTLKTRLGPHPGDTRIFEILSAAEEAGVAGLTVHARYTSQMHGGAVHLDTLAEVVRRARVPVTGNGSVVDAASAAAMAATGVAAIMIGRAALAHPDIFGKIRSNLMDEEEGRVPEASSRLGEDFARRHLDYLLEFRDRLTAKYPRDHVPSVDGFVSVKMHTHLFRYFSGRPGAAALRARLNTVRTLAEVRAILSATSLATNN